MDLAARSRRLEAAGLIVLDQAWNGPARPVLEAWAPIVRGGIEPDVRVDSTDDYLDRVNREWVRLAEQVGLFGESGDFLVSLADEGAAAAPWARVRRGPRLAFAEQLAPVAGEPEFVAMSTDSRVVCGVTTGEYDVWIVARALS